MGLTFFCKEQKGVKFDILTRSRLQNRKLTNMKTNASFPDLTICFVILIVGWWFIVKCMVNGKHDVLLLNTFFQNMLSERQFIKITCTKFVVTAIITISSRRLLTLMAFFTLCYYNLKRKMRRNRIRLIFSFSFDTLRLSMQMVVFEYKSCAF